jgi:hypothetical protein
VLCCAVQVVRVRFQHIALIASLAGGLAQYHDSLGVGLVDMVLEDVRWAGRRETQCCLRIVICQGMGGVGGLGYS